VPEPAPNAELLSALGRLVRGLSLLFWGLPLALVVCVQTAKLEWLRQLGVAPPLGVTALLFYGLCHLGRFQQQERIWQQTLTRGQLLALVNIGLSPFLYWWNRFPDHEFFTAMIWLEAFCALIFCRHLNRVVLRLSAMLPDETLRLEARQFTALNRALLAAAFWFTAAHLLLRRWAPERDLLAKSFALLERAWPWLLIPLVLLPLAMTMALLWKTKEVILDSVFGARR